VRLEPDIEPLIDPDGLGARLRARLPEPPRGGTPHEPVRLLAVAHSLTEGGAQRYLFDLLVQLRKDYGFAPTVLAPADGVYRQRFEKAGIHVHVAGPWPGNDTEAYEEVLRELVGWATPGKFDVVLLNTLLPFIGGDLASSLGLPFAWALHDSYDLSAWWIKAYGSDRGFGSAYVRSRAVEALRQASAVIFPAVATRSFYTRYVDDHVGIVVPNAVEVEALEAVRRGGSNGALRERLGWSSDEFLIVCLAIVAEPRKAQTSLVQALAAIHDEHPGVRLALVGDTPNEYSSALHTIVERAGLSDIVHFEPVTDAPYDWLLAADLFVLASGLEALPVSMLEAMALGTPVLATRVFGVPEVIEEGRTGLLCEPNDVGELAAALSRAVALPGPARAAMAASAREYVHAHHSAATYAARLAQLLNALAGGEGAAASPPVSAAP
jgi:glycosyltransferase involved in cell wall biosynthesis